MISLKELYDTLLSRSGVASPSYASLKQLGAMAIAMAAVRTTTLPTDAGSDYNAGYTSCTIHSVPNPTKDSLGEYSDTYVTHMAPGYAARQTIVACYCEARTGGDSCTCNIDTNTCDCEFRTVSCDCESRDECLCMARDNPSCTCNIKGGCACESDIDFCDCQFRTACTCHFDMLDCTCDNRTGPCDCEVRTADPVCTCDDRCRCNTVDLYTCPANT
jgi:hypothetical protein